MSLKSIKKGDTVQIISGKDKGKSGKVLRIFSGEDRIIVEGINIKKRHQRPKKEGERGQMVQVASPFHISNIMLMCPSCKKSTRKSVQIRKDGSRMRVCKKCKAEIN